MDRCKAPGKESKDLIGVEAVVVFVQVLHRDVAVFLDEVGRQPAFAPYALYPCCRGDVEWTSGDRPCVNANESKKVDGKQQIQKG